MELKGIKGIDTFVQNTEPSTKYNGDVWIRPGKQSKLVWSRDKWNRPFWKDVVSKILWGAGCEYGYVCGGYDATFALSTIDRIKFPFDSGTATHVGNLSTAKGATSSSCNSSNYGYNCGSTSISTIDRFTFPFDSGTATHVGNLNDSRKRSVGTCNSSNYGYICGQGYEYQNGTDFSVIERITFPFDSGTSSVVGNLSESKIRNSACNSSDYGYSCGGENGETEAVFCFSTVDRFTFPFDSGTTSHVGNLSGSNDFPSGCNSSNYGYSCGGTLGPGERISVINRFSFPFDSGTATHVGNLTESKTATCSNNSSNYGYIYSNYYNSSTIGSTIDRFSFPFDSGTATHVGNLSGTRHSGAGCDGVDFVTMFV